MIGFPRRAMNRLTTPGTEQSNVSRFFLGGRTTAGTFVDRRANTATKQ